MEHVQPSHIVHGFWILLPCCVLPFLVSVWYPQALSHTSSRERATPDAASNRGSRSPGDCSCGRLPGSLRESVPVSTFSELFDGPDRPGQQKPDQHHPLCAGER